MLESIQKEQEITGGGNKQVIMHEQQHQAMEGVVEEQTSTPWCLVVYQDQHLSGEILMKDASRVFEGVKRSRGDQPLMLDGAAEPEGKREAGN